MVGGCIDRIRRRFKGKGQEPYGMLSLLMVARAAGEAGACGLGERDDKGAIEGDLYFFFLIITSTSALYL